MLQIIGWKGCAYLIVTAFELFSVAKNWQDDKGLYDIFAIIGGSIALLSAIAFYFLLEAQVNDIPSSLGY